jgi:hypothetical protein
MMNILNEGLNYLDMEGQVSDKITVDEYAAKVGSDNDIVTITFAVHSKLAGKDLVTWFERGYDWVLDASLSDGEIEPNKWLVFVELDRRSTVPKRIITLLSDLGTLTGYRLKDWTVEVEGDDYDADEEILHQAIICNPNEYKIDHGDDEDAAEDNKDDNLNEVRLRAGIQPKVSYTNDEYIKNLKAMAGM